MLQRVFLGWDRPFLMPVADWLLERRDALPATLVLVPTTQAGRRLRETLAERAGSLLSPTFATPGSLFRTPSPEVAADWIEHLAWLETLENISNWQDFRDLFPQTPDDATSWASGLAREMVSLRHRLQENGLTLASAAKLLGASIESARWNDLARLENLMEKRLQAWGHHSRSRTLAKGIAIPSSFSSIVLAGITEIPPLVERSISNCGLPVHILIHAPEAEHDAFSASGKPLPCWTNRTMPWPHGQSGSVRLVADHRQEAAEALRAIAENQSPSEYVALGSPHPETGDELAACFTRAGWTAFHPASQSPPSGLNRWLRVWSLWLADPKLATLADLLALPETSALIGNYRAITTERLSRLRNDWMLNRPDDLRRRIHTESFRSESQKSHAELTLRSIETLENIRNSLLTNDWIGRLNQLIETIAQSSIESANEAAGMLAWLEQASPLIRKTGRDAGFWIGLMLGSLPPAAAQPPPGRVIDVEGWLELLFEPGSHLVLCGMNDGLVPARNSGDAWLGEAAARHLGLTSQDDRAARDAFLYHALLESRRTSGRVDLICAKTGPGGEALLPSRLLLAAPREDLPERVKFLFREIEPPEAGLRWQADWKWQPRTVPPPKRISVTSLATYLACPFRYYLKHAVGMQSPEPGRIEWNARDFGTVAHEVLERWGRDTEARSLNKTEAIHAWLSNELDQVVSAAFGKRPPLAVKIQAEALRQRFLWFSRIQACSHAEGWEIIDVEHKFEIPVADSVIVAKIDRIDRHRQSGALRVIDYKTGRVRSVESQHRRKLSGSTRLPEHITGDCPAIHSAQSGSKTADYRWFNLQLPLYAAALASESPAPPLPCYFTLGASETDAAVQEWSDFAPSDLHSAMECASWIVSRIHDGVFWPPAEKVEYDDYAPLCAGRPMDEMFSHPSPVPSPGTLG